MRVQGDHPPGGVQGQRPCALYSARHLKHDSLMLPPHLKFCVHQGTRVQLGVSGSVAAYKALELLRHFQELELRVGVTLTEAASRFVTPLSFEALGAETVYTSLWNTSDSAFGHLEPADEARCFVIAPATANTMARLAHGLADEILCAQTLAFAGPVVLAPAMNPKLWNAAATQENAHALQSRGAVLVDPDCGSMACGDVGKGRLAGLNAIVAHVLKALTEPRMAGTRVLVTLGPTREFFDPARFWSNPSTGLMGASLAVAAWLMGAEVTVVHGPVDLWLPGAIRRYGVQTAVQMFEACTDLWPTQDVGLMTAAVSDFSPVPFGPEKFKKGSLGEKPLTMEFTANPDILRTLGEQKAAGQKLLGFCAETGDLASSAARKLKEKNCDMLVANSIAAAGCGFAAPDNQVYVLDRAGRGEQWPLLSKAEVAWRLLEWMTQLLP